MRPRPSGGNVGPGKSSPAHTPGASGRIAGNKIKGYQNPKNYCTCFKSAKECPLHYHAQYGPPDNKGSVELAVVMKKIEGLPAEEAAQAVDAAEDFAVVEVAAEENKPSPKPLRKRPPPLVLSEPSTPITDPVRQGVRLFAGKWVRVRSGDVSAGPSPKSAAADQALPFHGARPMPAAPILGDRAIPVGECANVEPRPISPVERMEAPVNPTEVGEAKEEPVNPVTTGEDEEKEGEEDEKIVVEKKTLETIDEEEAEEEAPKSSSFFKSLWRRAIKTPRPPPPPVHPLGAGAMPPAKAVPERGMTPPSFMSGGSGMEKWQTGYFLHRSDVNKVTGLRKIVGDCLISLTGEAAHKSLQMIVKDYNYSRKQVFPNFERRSKLFTFFRQNEKSTVLDILVKAGFQEASYGPYLPEVERLFHAQASWAAKSVLEGEGSNLSVKGDVFNRLRQAVTAMIAKIDENDDKERKEKQLPLKKSTETLAYRIIPSPMPEGRDQELLENTLRRIFTYLVLREYEDALTIGKGKMKPIN